MKKQRIYDNIRYTMKGCGAMSTLEATIGIVELLTEDNLIKLQNVAGQLLSGQEGTHPVLTGMTKQRFLEELEVSRTQTENGEVKDAGLVTSELRTKYGL